MKSEYFDGISFSHKRGQVLVFKNTLRHLGSPRHIRFLLNTTDKKVAVQACEEIDRDSFAVPEKWDSFNSHFAIFSAGFVTMLYKLNGWDSESSYRIRGRHYIQYRLVEYDMNDAVMVSDEEFLLSD